MAFRTLPAMILCSAPLMHALDCNLTVYSQWQDEKYSGILANDVSFWRYGATQVRVLKSLFPLSVCPFKIQLPL